MNIISSFGLKGGIGKTTSVINYAAAFSFLGYRVLIIDVDDNAGIHKLLSKREDVIKTELFITDLLLDNQLSPIPFIQEHRGSTSSRRYPKTNIEIDFIPSSRTENEIFDQRLIAKRLDFKKESIFKELISKLQAEKQYDFIFFDVSPSAKTLTRLALLLTDWVIVNSRLSKQETKFYTDETIECLHEFSESIGRRIDVLGIQFNAFRKNFPTEYNRYREAKHLYKETILMPIPISRAISELEEETVFETTLASDLMDIYLSNCHQMLKKMNLEE